MTTPLQGVPWTGGGVDDLTAEVRADRLEGNGSGINVDDDTGVTVVSTNAATTLFASAMSIPANPVAGDVFVFESCGGSVNLEGSSRTFTFDHSIGGTSLFTAALVATQANLALKAWSIRTVIRCMTAGASGRLVASTRLAVTNDNASTVQYNVIGTKDLTSLDLTAAVAIGLTVQPSVSSANLSCGSYFAVLEKIRNGF